MTPKRESKTMNLRDQLQDYDAELPRSWRPMPGSVIVGTVRRYDRGESAYGPRWICMLHEDESGDAVGVWLSHTVLLGEFKDKRPKVGERIGIRRLDDSEKGYARYVLLVDGREPASEVPDFGSLGDVGDVAPEDREALAADVLDVAPDALPF